MQKGTPTSDRIGAYRVLRELSVTGPVQVHLACQESPNGSPQNVVLKVVPDAPGRDAKDTQELVREGTACSRMTHPGIVRTSKVFRHQDAVVFVVEHFDGVSLAEILALAIADGQRSLSDDAALLIGLSICDALAHAHATFDAGDSRSPIVHRTVSPSNILIGRDGSVKLDGFGFARVFGGVAAGRSAGGTWTPAFMAPEQVKDEPPTPRVDVYAAALILWELLTGRKPTILPRDPMAIEETLKAIAERQVEPLAKLRPDLAAPLTAAIDVALTPEPSKRNIGCAEIGRHIRKTFQFARGKGELRDRASSALARASASERRPVPQQEPSKPNAEASVPRAPVSAPRLGSAPRIESPPRVASAPRVPASPPRSSTSAPRLNAAAPRARHQTLVGIAPARLEDVAATTSVAATNDAAPATVPNSPPPIDVGSPPSLDVAVDVDTGPSEEVAATASPTVSKGIATQASPIVLDEEAPAPRSVVSTGMRAQINPFASTMVGPIPTASDVLATRDPENRVAIPPELAATLPATFDQAALRAELAVIERTSGPHSGQLAVTSDTPAAPFGAGEASAEDEPMPAGVPQRLTVGGLLKAPTRWRRSPWVAAWIVLGLGLGGLVVKVASLRSAPASVVQARIAPAVAPAVASAAPSPVAPLPIATPSPVATPSPPSEPAPTPATTTQPAEPKAVAQAEPALAAPSPPTVVDEAMKKSLLKRGLGLLTVHSTAPHASVYVNLKLYGGAEEGLTIPCGKQFISIGIPPRRPAQPVWLAPGKSMVIPCGGGLEMTMNPRPLR